MPRLGLGQHQEQRQELALLPRMLQSIELLRIPWAELDAYLADAVQSNEALRFDAPADRGLDRPRRSAAAAAEAADRHQAWLETLPSSPGGLAEHLESQLALLALPPRLESWTRFVIRCLDPTGYLTAPDETLLALAVDEGLVGDAADLGRAIAVVQTLEPRGVGGRDAVEALLLQLDPLESDYALLCRLIEEFVEELACDRLPAVARALDVDLDHLRRLLARLRELRLAPGAELVDEQAPPIRPDVVVRRVHEGDDRFEVAVDQSGLPAVSIDPEVARLARDRGQPADVRRHLRGQLERARWLVEGLEQRRRTLLRVASHVFARQHAFLERGPDHLVPLRMGEVADALELHLSTVSRAVAGKHAQTPFGILPLRSFFPAPAGGRSEAVVGDVHRALRAVIAAEDDAAPLSDDEIARRLAGRGFRVARRTVAKHRRELGIPSSYRRRRAG